MVINYKLINQYLFSDFQEMKNFLEELIIEIPQSGIALFERWRILNNDGSISRVITPMQGVDFSMKPWGINDFKINPQKLWVIYDPSKSKGYQLLTINSLIGSLAKKHAQN